MQVIVIISFTTAPASGEVIITDGEIRSLSCLSSHEKYKKKISR
tara:strand:+ start:269 stop:400 length:132 start_codon:yes stop_codon:yes gene_type:complete